MLWVEIQWGFLVSPITIVAFIVKVTFIRRLPSKIPYHSNGSEQSFEFYMYIYMPVTTGNNPSASITYLNVINRQIFLRVRNFRFVRRSKDLAYVLTVIYLRVKL